MLIHYKIARHVCKRMSLLIIVAFNMSYGTVTKAKVGAGLISSGYGCYRKSLCMAYLTKPYGTYK